MKRIYYYYKAIFVLFFYLLINSGFTVTHSNTDRNDQPLRPTGLTVNFLTHADVVHLNGYPVNILLSECSDKRENYRFASIAQKTPFFGWILNSNINSTLQTAYQILVSSGLTDIQGDIGDCWNSGKVESGESFNIAYSGKPLEPGRVYFWKVKTWDNNGVESQFSEIRQFIMADTLEDYATAVYPLQKMDIYPEFIEKISGSYTFIDFGRAGFGRLRLTLYGTSDNDTITIHLGEAVKNGKIDREPGGTIRYSAYPMTLKPGWHTYILTIKPDTRNTGPKAILLPKDIGEVLPFRYAEIENYKELIKPWQVLRETVFYPTDDEDSYFRSSDTILNKVWELCKYSIKATSFTGIYVDGDRERIPYEADALINQLSHYCVAREYSLARNTHEYLIFNPTWPTEWILQSVLIAWFDYMYTGNSESLSNFYNDLKAKTLLGLGDENGFISTRTGKVSEDILKSVHFNGNLRDIVDWPHTGILGLEKNEGGETDGFVFCDINTVVNAYHYRALVLMSKIAEVLQKENDEDLFFKRAEKLKRNINEKLYDKKRGVYIDGIGTDHASLHSNMFSLAFGIVPEKNIEKIISFIRSRGMACSVYGSQFLLDAVYDGNDADYGLQLLTSTGERSWYNMIRAGSTISMEAWDNKYKPNQDWNHAWGAAPANLIPRKLMGIEPLEPGFRKIQIKPQPSSLKTAMLKHPTIAGDILISFDNDPGQRFRLDITVPHNTTAEVYLPYYGKTQKITLNGKPVAYRQLGSYSVISNVGSGNSVFILDK